MTTITGSKPPAEVLAYHRKEDALMKLTDAEVLEWVNDADVNDIKKALKLLLLGHRELVDKGVI